jgi:preprotein translocase subunit SecA
MDDIAASPDVKSIEDFNAKLWEDPEFSARRDAVAGLLFGLDLFDVAKLTGFPNRLIDELTWDLGEEPSFFASGEFRGWPLRIWPTMMRPFIRLDGKSMCFDMWSLFDNIYRAIQRITCRLDPDYRETWNARQKAVTEQLPFKYFEKILPGMQSFTEVNYRWKSSAGKAQWHECDGLIVFDDHLFVLEVKAGAFTYTSPATDLAAHLSSLKGLLEAPANQGSRFVEYLESADEVKISDKDHNEIAKLNRSDFRHITIIAITLDAFTELAARAQHLRTVGVDVGNRSVWALSIDDLRVYADLCTNPLMFLHFVEQRMAASKQELIDLNDEVDHYGLYLEQNNYSQFATELMSSSGAKLNFNGYRAPIDEFYSASMHGEKPAPPQQVMPSKIFEIIDFLAHSLKRGRSQLASFLLDAAGDFREEIAKGIEDQLDGNRQLKRQRPILMSGENPFTICTSSPDVPRDKIEALDYCRSLVAANGEKSRLLLELEYDSDDKLVEVNWQTVTLSPISLVKNISAYSRGIRLRQQRVSDARMNGKIPVNSMCPCGSGKKYKKCCRP